MYSIDCEKFGFGYRTEDGVGVVRCKSVEELRWRVRNMVRRGHSWLWVWCDGGLWEFEGGRWRKVR